MISQNVPIASQLLKNVSQEWMTFRFGHGVTAKNLRELAHALSDMNQVEFEQYVHDKTNDIALWVEIVIGDGRLAAKLRLLATPEAAGRMVLRRVEELTASLPVGPTTEEIVAQLDVAMAHSARKTRRVEREPAMANYPAAAVIAAQSSAKAPRAKRTQSQRSATPRAAATKREKPAAKKKGSIFARLLGW